MRSALVLCLIALMADVCLAEDKKGPTVKTAMVRAEDLSSGKYQIEGRLGKPYGTILKIRGVWEGGDMSIRRFLRSRCALRRSTARSSRRNGKSSLTAIWSNG